MPVNFFLLHSTLHRVVGQVLQDLTHSTKRWLLVVLLVKDAMHRKNEFGKILAEPTATDLSKFELHKNEKKKG